MKTIRDRKSIRKYKSQPIPKELLHQLLEDAERTQTLGNLQLYSVVITQDEEAKRRLASAHFNQPMVTNAPVVLTFCADFNRTSVWCKARKAEPGYANFLSFLNAASDALLYVQTFCTLAEEAGLGICYLGTTLYMPDPIIDALKLPPLTMPIAAITVGYPDEDPKQVDRLPLEAIIHYEEYRQYDNVRIDELYKVKEELEENLNYMKINKKETLAQIFTDIRYKKSDNESLSTKLLATLKRQGFLSDTL